MAGRAETAMITGASAGIGATYADRLAMRGYDLILVARDETRLKALASKLRAKSGARMDVLRADLTDRADLARAEHRLKADPAVTLLINNAGAAGGGGFETPDVDAIEQIIALNVTAVTRLGAAAASNFAAGSGGSIVNIASVLAYSPERSSGIYSATKAFVINFSRSLQLELGAKGVYVQIVAPAATATEIWARSGTDVSRLPPGTVMRVEDLVDAALVGFDRKELFTFPSLPDESQWEAFEAARLAMAPNFRSERPAERYLARMAR